MWWFLEVQSAYSCCTKSFQRNKNVTVQILCALCTLQQKKQLVPMVNFTIIIAPKEKKIFSTTIPKDLKTWAVARILVDELWHYNKRCVWKLTWFSATRFSNFAATKARKAFSASKNLLLFSPVVLQQKHLLFVAIFPALVREKLLLPLSQPILSAQCIDTERNDTPFHPLLSRELLLWFGHPS